MLSDQLLFLAVGLVIGLLFGWISAPGRCPDDDQRRGR